MRTITLAAVAAALLLAACGEHEEVSTNSIAVVADATTSAAVEAGWDRHGFADHLHNMTMEQVRAEIGSPASARDDEYGTKVWTYYNLPVVDKDSGASGGAIYVHFAPDETGQKLSVEYVAY